MAVIYGTEENSDDLDGTSGDDQVFGFGGDDSIYASDGADALDGGDGADWIHYSRYYPDPFASGAVIVNLTTGTGAGAMAFGDTYTSIET